MRPRLIASAAAVLTAALATSADPLPLPVVGGPPARPAVTAPALPIPIVSNPGQPKPFAPSFLPTAQPEGKLEQPPKTLPVVPRAPGDTLPSTSNAPGPVAEPYSNALPCDKSLCDDHLGPWNAIWVRGGYNYLWIKDAPRSPTLLATGPAGATRGLVGGRDTDYGGFSGLSFDGGFWLNQRHTFGLGLGGFISEKRSVVASATSDAAGAPGLFRPFFNPQIGGANGQDALIVSDPGRFAGSLAVEQGARIAGFEINLLLNVANTPCWTTNYVFGMRYFDLDEYQTIYQVTQGLNGNTIPFFGGAPVDGVAITDRFRTRNQFYGTQMGADAEYRFGPMFLDFGLKAALGPVHQVTEVSGQTVVPGGPGGPGGFLAVGIVPNGNQGRTTTNYFGVLADANTLIGVQISNNLRVGFGYQFLYLNTVARPANQIVTNIDPRLVPTSTSFGGRTTSSTFVGGPGTPPFTPFNRDDFFVHGLRFLFEVQY